MTEIVRHQAETDAVEFHRPDLHQWAANLAAAHQIGSALCGTSFAPVHFRGKPDEAAAAILYGSEVGFTPTQALQNLYVIGGKPALYARPMVAIVQAAGHEVWTESKTDESVTVCGKRRGSDKVISETWTIDRAKRAGYTNNKKYQTDPQAMLYARAASDVCRQIAADALAGMAYSVEELELAGGTPDTGRPVAPQVTAGDFIGHVPNTSTVRPPADETFTETPEGDTADIEDAEEVDEPKLTARQRGKLFALFGQKGIAEDEQLPGIAHIVGRPVEHRDALTTDEFDKVIAALEQQPDAEATA